MKAVRLELFTCVVTYATHLPPTRQETFFVFARNALTAKFMVWDGLSLSDRALAIEMSAKLNGQ